MKTLKKLAPTLAVVALLLALASTAIAGYVNFAGRIVSTTFSTTSAITSDDLVGDLNTTRVIFFILSTKGGTLQAQYYPITGSPVDIPTGTLSVTANTLGWLFLDMPVPKSRVVFTPSSAAPGDSVWVDAFAISGGRR